MKCDVTYSCGHERTVHLFGPASDRKRKIKWLGTIPCPDCEKEAILKARQEENEKAAAQSSEMGLPQLEGTPAQVAWAITIRLNRLTEIEEFIEAHGDNPDYSKTIEGYSKTAEYVVPHLLSASWWIDSRDLNLDEFAEIVLEMIPADVAQADADQAAMDKVLDESLVVPEDPTTTNPVVIIVRNDVITAKFEKNERFIAIVKRLGYKWTGAWEMEIGVRNGPVEDRIAELGHALLAAGFPVRITDVNARKKAIEGTFTPRQTRWMERHVLPPYSDWIGLSWSKEDNLYNRARSLPGSKYHEGQVVVNPKHFGELREFAALYGFKFTKRAMAIVFEAEAVFENARRVKVSPVSPERPGGLKAILESSDEVIKDLKEEPE